MQDQRMNAAKILFISTHCHQLHLLLVDLHLLALMRVTGILGKGFQLSLVPPPFLTTTGTASGMGKVLSRTNLTSGL